MTDERLKELRHFAECAILGPMDVFELLDEIDRLKRALTESVAGWDKCWPLLPGCHLDYNIVRAEAWREAFRQEYGL